MSMPIPPPAITLPNVWAARSVGGAGGGRVDGPSSDIEGVFMPTVSHSTFSVTMPCALAWREKTGAVQCRTMHIDVLYCTVLYCTVLYCTVLYCTVLYCTVLYCTITSAHFLFFVLLHFTSLHFNHLPFLHLTSLFSNAMSCYAMPCYAGLDTEYLLGICEGATHEERCRAEVLLLQYGKLICILCNQVT